MIIILKMAFGERWYAPTCSLMSDFWVLLRVLSSVLSSVFLLCHFLVSQSGVTLWHHPLVSLTSAILCPGSCDIKCIDTVEATLQAHHHFRSSCRWRQIMTQPHFNHHLHHDHHDHHHHQHHCQYSIFSYLQQTVTLAWQPFFGWGSRRAGRVNPLCIIIMKIPILLFFVFCVLVCLCECIYHYHENPDLHHYLFCVLYVGVSVWVCLCVRGSSLLNKSSGCDIFAWGWGTFWEIKKRWPSVFQLTLLYKISVLVIVVDRSSGCHIFACCASRTKGLIKSNISSSTYVPKYIFR